MIGLTHGFRFVATRREDGADHELETASDGSSNPISVPIGTYDVCETGTPDWATTLIDSGCVELVVDVGRMASTSPLVVAYTNKVPQHTIDTRAADRVDGDRSMFTPGGTIVDEVRLAGLVPRTTYTLIGEALGLGVEPRLAGAVVEATFTASSPEHTLELEFEVSDRAPGSVVIVERLLVGDRVIAAHDDLTDPDQTITMAAPPTTTTTTTTTLPTATLPPSTVPGTTPAQPETTSTTSTTTLPTATLPPSTVPATTTSPTLPPTGSADASGRLLRLGDIGFVLGVGLIVLAGLAPRGQPRA